MDVASSQGGLQRAVGWMGRRYPLYRGCGRLGNSALIRRLSQGEELRVRLRDGSLIFVRDDEFVGRAIAYFGDFDRKVTWVCRNLLRAGDLMIDVGANYGVVTLQAARLVGPTGHVHAVEPQPALAASLRRSLSENEYSHVDVHELGLSSSDGTMELFVPAANTGSASLTRHADIDGETAQVSVRSAGAFLTEISAGRRPRLLKLDIEGHEAVVLENARQYFAEVRPENVLFESNEHSVPFWERDTIEIVQDLGYRLHEVELRSVRPALRVLQPGDDVHGNDFLAVLDR